MKSILEVSGEFKSLKRRTIKSLATEDISSEDSEFITERIDAIVDRIGMIKHSSKEEENGA